MTIKREKTQKVMHSAIARHLLTEPPSQTQIGQPVRQFPQFLHTARRSVEYPFG